MFDNGITQTVMYVFSGCYLLNMVTVCKILGYKRRLRDYELSLVEREKELDKVERWLDKREIKLEKSLDRLKRNGVVL